MKKIFYIKTRKTGGTSLVRSIKRCPDITSINITKYNYKNDYTDKDIVICPCYFYKMFHDELSTRYKDYEKITIVRNPISKTISAWKYCQSTRGKSLIECLNDPPSNCISPSTWYSDWMVNHDWVHFTRSQTDGLIYKGKKQYDKLFKLEEYNKIIQYLNKRFDINLKIFHINRNCNSKTEITQEEKDKIYQMYEDDFINFGYSLQYK